MKNKYEPLLSYEKNLIDEIIKLLKQKMWLQRF